jgi:hypothetical protein
MLRLCKCNVSRALEGYPHFENFFINPCRSVVGIYGPMYLSRETLFLKVLMDVDQLWKGVR